MSFLKKLLGQKTGEAKTRVRICVECGMPVGEHKDWCSILRTQQVMAQRPADSAGALR